MINTGPQVEQHDAVEASESSSDSDSSSSGSHRPDLEVHRKSQNWMEAL